MKLFLDSARPDEIRAAAVLGVIDGVTMNPKLLAAQALPVDELVAAICDLVPDSVSVPVRSNDANSIVEEAQQLAGLHDRVVVKLPVHREGLRAMSRLRNEGIRTHATLCCSASQALLAAKCGAYYISPFIGHLDSSGQSGIEIVARIIEIYDNYDYDTQVMVASIRNAQQVQESAVLGADACTLKAAVLEELIRHPMTEKLHANDVAAWTQS